MAEFVNQRLEDMLAELEQMKRMELYTPDEIKEISKKRTDFEYKMKRQMKSKEDYLSYIAYECLLLEDIVLKRRRMNNQEKKADIEYAMTKRIKSLYKDLVHRFPSDLELWLSYILFCKNAKLTRNVTPILEAMLQVHGDKPRMWQVACRWELDEMKSITTARNFILKGIQRHPSCSELYFEALKMELIVAGTKDNELGKATQMERVKIFIKNARKHIQDVTFLIEVCCILGQYEFAEDTRLMLVAELWENYNDQIEAWEYIAKCELEEKNVEGFQWKSINEQFTLINCPQKVQNFCNVFETAVSQIPTSETCDSYIKNSLILCASKRHNPIVKLQIVKRALTKGHELGKLTEEQYKLWLDLMIYNDAQDDEIDKALEEACQHCPTSEFLWSERLQRCDDDPIKLVKIFNQAEETLPSEKVTLLWIILLQKTNNLDDLEKLHHDSLRLLPEVVRKLKPEFIKQFYKCGGIPVARKMYNSMVITPPFTMELHKLMMTIEVEQSIPSYKEWKICHENATRQFGKTNPEVWLDFIQFEKQQGHPENCGALYTRACATLDKKYVDKFIVDYTLNKHKK